MFTRRLITLAVPTALVAAACGGGGGTDSAATTAAGSATTQAGGSPTTAGGGGTAKVRVAHLPSALFAPMYVADAKGYFRDAGLEVTMEAMKSGQDAVPLVSTGKLEAMVAGFSAGMFSAVNQGLDFKVVGSMGASNGDLATCPTSLNVSPRNAETVKTVQDLKGKKVALAGGPGAAGGYLMGSILKDNGMTIKDISVVNLATPDMLAALNNGSVDAALPSAPYSTAIEQAGGKRIAVPKAGVYSTGILYGGAFLKTPQAQTFFDCLVKGAADIDGGKLPSDEIAKIISDVTKQDIEVVKKTTLYTWDAKLAPNEEHMTTMQQVWIDAAQLPYKEPLPASKFLDKSFSDKAKK